jgi:methyl-accepting chemotaxis protein
MVEPMMKQNEQNSDQDPRAGMPELELYKAAFKKAEVVCNEAAKGNLEARITEIGDFGEIGGMLHAINRMLDLTDAFVRESGASLTYASEDKFFRRFLLRGMLGSFRRGAATINTARESMETKARLAAQAAAKERRLKVAETFASRVSDVIETVSVTATEMEATATTMSTLATTTHEQSVAVAAAAEETTVSVQTVASASQQLSAAITEISRRVSESTAATQGAVDGMARVNDAVEGLAEAAEQIDKVVEFIRNIAGKTNLLALNATIEAARAGEAGRGFAVVASEVKSLALQTATATNDITAEIRGIQEASQLTATAAKGIEENISEVSEISTTIASAIEEQSAATNEISTSVDRAAEGTGQVSGNVSKISGASQQTGSAATEVLECAGRLARQATMLTAEVENFLEEFRAA